MSLHFEFTLTLDLKPETPQQVIDTLAYMTRSEEYEFSDPPSHPWFESDDEWRETLQADPEATHLPGNQWTVFRQAYRYTQHGVDQYRWTLSFRREMLDDEFYEDWWQLADWLARWSETQGFVGYYREEFNRSPTLIYFLDGQAAIVEVTAEPVPLSAGSDAGETE
jgi:hypothetical protein